MAHDSHFLCGNNLGLNRLMKRNRWMFDSLARARPVDGSNATFCMLADKTSRKKKTLLFWYTLVGGSWPICLLTLQASERRETSENKQIF